MAPADPHLITLFAAALERESDADRAAYLDEACGPDPALRERVEALLRAHAGAGHFLEGRGDDTPTSLPATETASAPGMAAGEVLAGRYKLLEPLGEGGMGSVWMAQQTEPVRRLVAVKLIRPGMDTRQVLARFEAERQALALMDHPNIAKVLDGGLTPDGRPYFVMELVKGVPITRFCNDRHLTPHQRLELFVPVCQAVQHAHQKGVIHRDLKPSNVLVALYDDKPVPKVIDFGVAKATGQQLTEQTLHTGFGAVVGTLEYMSPEQAGFNNLDIDTRSDVYSLGVLLYELLTGGPPFSKADLGRAGVLEMLRVVREVDPPKPSTRLSTTQELPSIAASRGLEPRRLTALVRGELDWIVMKALEKDRSRRYETATGLALDVQRYLSNEQVLACPASAGYRLRKFVRRNRGPVLAAGLLLLSLTAGAVGTARGLVEARQERDAARQAEADAKADRQKADQAEQEAKAFSDFLVNHFLAPEEVPGAFVAFAFENFGMATREEVLLLRPGADMRMSEALAAAERSITPRTLGLRPLAEATARHAIGLAWLALGRHADAARQLGLAFELRERALGPDHEDTVASAATLGRVLVAAGRPEEAIPMFETVRAQREGKYGSHFRAENGYHPAQALTALYDLAKALRAAGRLPEAIRLLEELNGRQLENIRPDRPRTGGMKDYVAFSPGVVRDLAAAYQAADRADDATRLLADTLARLRAEFGPSNVHAQLVRMAWSRALRAEGQFDKRVEVNRESVDAIRREGRNLVQLAVGLWHLGDSLLGAGRPAEAEPVLMEGLTLWEKTDPNAWPRFDVQHLLGVALLRQGRYADAERLLLAGYAGLVERAGKQSGLEVHEFAAAADRLVELYTALGKPAEAARWRAERAKYPELGPPPRLVR